MGFRTITTYVCDRCNESFDDYPEGHDCRSEEQKAADAAEAEKFDKAFDYWKEQEEKLGIEHATMSVYEVKAHHQAVKGKCVLVHRDYCPHDGKPYVSRVLNNPTWATVLKHFDKAIPVTGDFHHIFLEGIGRIDGTKYVARDLPNDCKVYVFHTGS